MILFSSSCLSKGKHSPLYSFTPRLTYLYPVFAGRTRMGEFDTYCAICGVCNRKFTIESNTDKTRRVRSKVIRNRRRQRLDNATRGARNASPDEMISGSDEGFDLRDEEHSSNLSTTYDPQVLEGHDTSWITKLLLVASDPYKAQSPAVFLCGPVKIDANIGLCNETEGGEQYGVGHYDCAELILYCEAWTWNHGNSNLGTYPCHVLA